MCYFFLFQIPDIHNCQLLNCPTANDAPSTVKLSLDGISESQSTNISLDVYSIKINDCQCVYPVRIIRPLNKLSVDYMGNFKKVLDELNENGLILSHVIADNPKRAFVRNSLSHGAKFACEYCFSNGISLKDLPQIKQQMAACEKKSKNSFQRKISRIVRKNVSYWN